MAVREACATSGATSPGGDVDVEAIRTEGLTKHSGAVAALEELDLTVEQGEVFGFLGPNGAGKTTTIRLLLRLSARRPAGLDYGLPAADVGPAHRHVGYVPGDVALWPQLSGGGRSPAGQRRPAGRRGLTRELIRAPPDLDSRAAGPVLSKGNRQKVALSPRS